LFQIIIRGPIKYNNYAQLFTRGLANYPLVSTTQTQNQVEGGLLLDVVIREGPSILELLAGKDQTLLVRGDAFLVLDLGLHRLDGVRALHLEGDGLPREGLDEDLHSTTETEHQVEGGLLLNVVVGEGPSVLELLASKDETLLVRGDTLLILDLRLDTLNSVRGLDLQGDSLASKRLHEDLHSTTEAEHQVEGGLLLNVVVG